MPLFAAVALGRFRLRGLVRGGRYQDVPEVGVHRYLPAFGLVGLGAALGFVVFFNHFLLVLEQQFGLELQVVDDLLHFRSFLKRAFVPPSVL